MKVKKQGGVFVQAETKLLKSISCLLSVQQIETSGIRYTLNIK